MTGGNMLVGHDTVVVVVDDDDEDDKDDLQARTTGRQQRLERGREINVRPTKIEDVPFR